MRKLKKWVGIASILIGFALSPMTALAGWEAEGEAWRYRDENGSYASARWIEDGGAYYYLDERGYMAESTTTPDGYLVGADGKWVMERQESGNYVRTPYDNRPYFYDPNWKIYVFDTIT